MPIFKRAALAATLLACAPIALATSELLLAPGKSVTLIDAEKPWLQILVTAPIDAPLDVGALVRASGAKSVTAVVTALHAKPAGRFVANADGSISIGSPERRAAQEPTNLVEGGIFVLDGGRLSPQRTPAAARAALANRPEMLNARYEPPMPVLPAVPQQGTHAMTPAAPASIANTGSTISFGSFGVGSGSLTASGIGGVTAAGSAVGTGGSIQITSPNGVTLQSGTISVGGSAIAPAGTVSGSGVTLGR
jgi:hypothetical protein